MEKNPKISTMVYKFHFPKKYKKYNNSCAETLTFTLIGRLTHMIVCLIIDKIHDRVSECSMIHSNRAGRDDVTTGKLFPSLGECLGLYRCVLIIFKRR